MTPAQAAEKIWALVSGFPPNKAQNRNFVVVQCYVDGSGTGDPGLFVMGGYIASAKAWAAFSGEWQERLNMRPQLPYFKMSEMAQSPERLERAGWFYRVIEDHVGAAISCVIPVQTLIKCVREAKWPPGMETYFLENPYYFAYYAMVTGVSHEQLGWGLNEPVDFIFDEEAIRKFPPEGWARMKLAATPDARRMMGDFPIYRNDQTTLPLQAADLWAWWVRKWAMEGETNGVRDLKFPWPVRHRNLLRFNMPFIEQDFRDMMERMVSAKTLAIATHPDPFATLRAVERREYGIKMTLPDPSSPLNWPEQS